MRKELRVFTAANYRVQATAHSLRFAAAMGGS